MYVHIIALYISLKNYCLGNLWKSSASVGIPYYVHFIHAYSQTFIISFSIANSVLCLQKVVARILLLSNKHGTVRAPAVYIKFDAICSLMGHSTNTSITYLIIYYSYGNIKGAARLYIGHIHLATKPQVVYH